MDKAELKEFIRSQGSSLGFEKVRISDPDLFKYEEGFKSWISNGYQGSMEYMISHGLKRMRPKETLPEVKSIISVSLNYFPEKILITEILNNNEIGYISRYALGRDYHKVVKKKLKQLCEKLIKVIPEIKFRIFVDSAPVYERGFAEKSGIGWTGKNSLTLNTENGSFFFLGQIFTDLELTADEPIPNRCGKCSICKVNCPTNAIIADGVIDARRCISYLTIENKNSIPVEYRKLIGNRIYGCDDCQIVCPWNKKTKFTKENDFAPRVEITDKNLVDLFNWDENKFLKLMEGSAIRRIGFERWMRNIAVAIGNADYSNNKIQLLKSKLGKISDMVDEHIYWAIDNLNQKK